MDKKTHLTVLTINTWYRLLADGQGDETVTVSRYAWMLKSYASEIVERFHMASWEDQIKVAELTHDATWIQLLDSEQLAAYRIVKD